MAPSRFAWMLAALVVAGCAGDESASPDITTPATSVTPTPTTERTELRWQEHEHLGSILVDGDGRTLYVFTRDTPNASACSGDCASAWPPVTAADTDAPADLAKRVSTFAREDGQAQVAIDGRPLYRYAADAEAGDANGQGRNGAWFVIRETDAPGQRNVDFLDGPGEHDVLGENATFGDGARGYLARPTTNGSYPGVVMVHEWWGLNEHIRAMADALASHGYHVLAVDLYDGEVATTQQEALAQVQGLDQENATAAMRAATARLRDDGATKVGALGWCFGGGQALQLALSGEPLHATVMYYGNPVTNETRLAAIDWPLLGIFGAEDTSIPVANVTAFESALTNASVEHDIQIYNGVGHAFANPSGNAYAAEEAMDAWARTLGFLDAHLR